MNFAKACIVAVALIGGAVDARKRLIEQSTGLRVSAPNVRDCEPVCIFGDSEKSGDKETNDHWCLEFTSPHLQVGWSFKQKYSTTSVIPILDYYLFQWHPYAQGYFYMKSIFDINRLYYNEFIADMPKWKVLVFAQHIVNSDFRSCWGLGWENQNIKVSIQMKQQFMDCYKNLIYDICSTDGVWKGKTASIFEKCERSDQDNDDLTADFTEWDLLEAKSDQILMGTVDPSSTVHCICLPGLSKGCSSSAAARTEDWDPVEKMAYQFYGQMGSYFRQNYPQGFDLTWLPGGTEQHIPLQ